jgi:energy-coupling factor transporter ATP-binding protein EcfA2
VSETTAQSTVPAPSTEQREESTKSTAYPSAAAQAAAALTAHLPQRDDRDSARPRQADILRQIGETGYRFVRSDQTIYAVQIGAGPIARPIRSKGGGGGTGSLRQCLIREYVLSTGRTPSQAALADAIAALEAMAMDSESQDVHLRVAADQVDRWTTWLDLGRSDGLSVCIERGSWAVLVPHDGEGPLWRRSRLVHELPVPERTSGGWQHGVELLRRILPVSADSYPMVVAWCLAALRPDMPRPLAGILGEQGTGKSTLCRMMVRLVDGTKAHLRSVPKSEDDLAVTTAAGWCLALDNLSGMPGWLSDFLSRTVTGDALTKRELYSDDDVVILIYQRPVLLTSIEIGVMQGDLAERMLPIQLEPITGRNRRTERRLWEAYNDSHPEILGGLLDLAALVWAKIPEASDKLAERPRMADWAEMLWALDAVTGWHTLDTYTGAQEDLVDDVIEGDPVATSVLHWATSRISPWTWEGQAAQLLAELQVPPNTDKEKDWPRTPAVLSARLQRAAPALRRRGVDVRKLPRTKSGRPLRISTGPGPANG